MRIIPPPAAKYSYLLIYSKSIHHGRPHIPHVMTYNLDAVSYILWVIKDNMSFILYAWYIHLSDRIVYIHICRLSKYLLILQLPYILLSWPQYCIHGGVKSYIFVCNIYTYDLSQLTVFILISCIYN